MQRWIGGLIMLVVLGNRGYGSERLGEVHFLTSCSPSVQARFNRGIALLHDFWYDEARRQFQEIVSADPHCAMAHWGIAMSEFHQIWNRPDAASMVTGRKQMQQAAEHPAKTPRERAYVDALSSFYTVGSARFETRVQGYASTMRSLSRRYPNDVDAAAFSALALLAAEAPSDTSLTAEHEAAQVLQPWFAKAPNNPGVAHYLIHACDTPTLAPDGLAAARRYGLIAASGAHAAHMPGHIFARLGLWQEDIDANIAAVLASEAAQAKNPGEGFDEFHANEFLLYAYLQSGQETRAREVSESNTALLARFETMPTAAHGHMGHLWAFYRVEFPAIYALETRDWTSAAALPVAEESGLTVQLMALWARIVADGHLSDAPAAHAQLEQFQTVMMKLKASDEAYKADSTWNQVLATESLGWTAFADGQTEEAESQLRRAADLQDKVGQSEVDIPAREMLADVLLLSHRPAQALIEYDSALKLSPNRFNGLYNAGQAAEAIGNADLARRYYQALLASTTNGAQSTRAEVVHAREF